jgi:hypothetical protein
VFRRQDNTLISHTGQPAGEIKAVFLDEEGNILLDTALGIGLLDDRELAGFLAECQIANGQIADEPAWLDLMAGLAISISWQNLSLQRIVAVDLPKRFKFQPHPQP